MKSRIQLNSQLCSRLFPSFFNLLLEANSESEEDYKATNKFESKLKIQFRENTTVVLERTFLALSLVTQEAGLCK